MSERLGAGYGEVYVAGADPSFAWAHVDRLDAPAEPKWPSPLLHVLFQLDAQ